MTSQVRLSIAPFKLDYRDIEGERRVKSHLVLMRITKLTTKIVHSFLRAFTKLHLLLTSNRIEKKT